MTSAPLVSPRQLGAQIAARREPGAVLIAGITGSVAAGKSTLAAGIADSLSGAMQVEILSTDGFLFPNAKLQARDLLMRKGFPETCAVERLADTLGRLRTGPVRVPGYSHQRYDVDPALERVVDQPDLVLVEGLGIAPQGDDHSVLQALDMLLYVDATEEDLEHWFVDRFISLWRAAADDPDSFYARFRTMSEPEARGFARTAVWRGINLPNLQDHIVRAHAHADILLWKERDHRLRQVRPAA